MFGVGRLFTALLVLWTPLTGIEDGSPQLADARPDRLGLVFGSALRLALHGRLLGRTPR